MSAHPLALLAAFPVAIRGILAAALLPAAALLRARLSLFIIVLGLLLAATLALILAALALVTLLATLVLVRHDTLIN